MRVVSVRNGTICKTKTTTCQKIKMTCMIMCYNRKRENGE